MPEINPPAKDPFVVNIIPYINSAPCKYDNKSLGEVPLEPILAMATVDGDLHAPLLRLPQEVLVSGVARYLTTVELGSLRLTCKHIENELFESFAHEFFHKKSFLLEEPSLQTLLSISQHPGLRVHLTDLIIDSRMLVTPLWTGSTLPTSMFMDGNQFLQSGLARDMLVEALQGLPNVRTISYRDFDSAGRSRDGPNAMWRPWGYSLSESNHLILHSSEHKLILVLLACALAGTRPTKLEVLLRRFPKLDPSSLPSPRSFAHPRRFFDLGLHKVLQGLKVLILAVTFEPPQGSSRYDPREYVDENRIEAPLRSFLLSTPELEVLRLNFVPGDKYATPFLSWMGRRASGGPGQTVSTLKLEFLTTLDLGKATVSPSRIISVLTKFDVKSISLWEITLRDETMRNGPCETDLWSVTLQTLSLRLSAHSRVCDVMIGRLRQTDSVAYSRGVSDNIRFVAEGTPADKKEYADKQDTVKFERKRTGKTVHEWLKELSGRTYVLLHYVSENGPSISDEGDSEDDDEDLGESEEDFNDDDDEGFDLLDAAMELLH